MSESSTIARNALTWFEIPTVDFDRARRFYETVLERPVPEQVFGSSRIALFSYDPNGGAGGCLDEESRSRPSADGVVIYLSVDGRFDRALELVEAAGGRIAAPKERMPGVGDVAHVVDSEGNRIGLHAKS